MLKKMVKQMAKIKGCDKGKRMSRNGRGTERKNIKYLERGPAQQEGRGKIGIRE